LNELSRLLSNIAVSVFLSLHTLQILFFNQNVDALLDDLNFRLKAPRKLVEDLGNELRVVESFAHFHDADNGGLDEHLTVFFNVFVGHLLFSLLFRLQWEVDVDTKLFAKSYWKVSNMQKVSVSGGSLLLEKSVQSDFRVLLQIGLRNITLEQTNLEENAQDLLQVLLTYSC
jgi:hypothetical protein